VSETVALVMAGGRGERMRASGEPVPKPLVPVARTPLIEHNVRLLLGADLADIVVAVRADDDAVTTFCHERLAPVVAARGGSLSVLAEPRPLGNAGAAGLLRDRAANVVMVYADNLTVLDLRTVVAAHRDRAADLTLATHEHPFRLPYGALTLDGDRVTAYREKPQVTVTVASAVCVLGPVALAAIDPAHPTGLSDLTTTLLDSGATVIAHPHDDGWVDVNSTSSLAEAEELVAAHPDTFPWSRA
jgi:mannose-1-phosphate guanylyltransferase/phosphomannomutase